MYISLRKVDFRGSFFSVCWLRNFSELFFLPKLSQTCKVIHFSQRN